MKKIICIFISLMIIVICFSGCDILKDEEPTTDYSDAVPAKKDSETIESEDFYTVISNGDFTYTYEIRDRQGNMLLYESQCEREPHIEMLNDNLLKCMIQYGTGITAQSTFYVNVETGAVSEAFNSVYDEHEGRTAYFLYLNSKHFMVVQDIFDKEVFYKEIQIPGDFHCVEAVVECDFSEDGKTLDLVCKVGADFTETEITLNVE